MAVSPRLYFTPQAPKQSKPTNYATISAFRSTQMRSENLKSRKGGWSLGRADQIGRRKQPGNWREGASQQLQRTMRDFSENRSRGRKKERSPLVSSLERRPQTSMTIDIQPSPSMNQRSLEYRLAMYSSHKKRQTFLPIHTARYQ